MADIIPRSQDFVVGVMKQQLGYCFCGCGLKTNVANKTDRCIGWTKGVPLKYVLGHNPRKPITYKVSTKTGCWISAHPLATKGYAAIMRNSRRHSVHRIMYELKYGSVPDGLELDHICRNRACVNPDHLRPITHAENVRCGSIPRLSEEDVRKLRKRRARGEFYRILAHDFGVSISTAHAVASGKTWKGV